MKNDFRAASVAGISFLLIAFQNCAGNGTDFSSVTTPPVVVDASSDSNEPVITPSTDSGTVLSSVADEADIGCVVGESLHLNANLTFPAGTNVVMAYAGGSLVFSGQINNPDEFLAKIPVKQFLANGQTICFLQSSAGNASVRKYSPFTIPYCAYDQSIVSLPTKPIETIFKQSYLNGVACYNGTSSTKSVTPAQVSEATGGLLTVTVN